MVEVALERGFHPVFRFPCANRHSPIPYIPSAAHEVCDSPDQTTRYHTHRSELGATSLACTLAARTVNVIYTAHVFLLYIMLVACPFMLYS